MLADQFLVDLESGGPAQVDYQAFIDHLGDVMREEGMPQPGKALPSTSPSNGASHSPDQYDDSVPSPPVRSASCRRVFADVEESCSPATPAASSCDEHASPNVTVQHADDLSGVLSPLTPSVVKRSMQTVARERLSPTSPFSTRSRAELPVTRSVTPQYSPEAAPPAVRYEESVRPQRRGLAAPQVTYPVAATSPSWRRASSPPNASPTDFESALRFARSVSTNERDASSSPVMNDHEEQVPLRVVFSSMVSEGGHRLLRFRTMLHTAERLRLPIGADELGALFESVGDLHEGIGFADFCLLVSRMRAEVIRGLRRASGWTGREAEHTRSSQPFSNNEPVRPLVKDQSPSPRPVSAPPAVSASPPWTCGVEEVQEGPTALETVALPTPSRLPEPSGRSMPSYIEESLSPSPPRIHHAPTPQPKPATHTTQSKPLPTSHVMQLASSDERAPERQSAQSRLLMPTASSRSKIRPELPKRGNTSVRLSASRAGDITSKIAVQSKPAPRPKSSSRRPASASRSSTANTSCNCSDAEDVGVVHVGLRSSSGGPLHPSGRTFVAHRDPLPTKASSDRSLQPPTPSSIRRASPQITPPALIPPPELVAEVCAEALDACSARDSKRQGWVEAAFVRKVVSMAVAKAVDSGEYYPSVAPGQRSVVLSWCTQSIPSHPKGGGIDYISFISALVAASKEPSPSPARRATEAVEHVSPFTRQLLAAREKMRKVILLELESLVGVGVKGGLLPAVATHFEGHDVRRSGYLDEKTLRKALVQLGHQQQRGASLETPPAWLVQRCVKLAREPFEALLNNAPHARDPDLRAAASGAAHMLGVSGLIPTSREAGSLCDYRYLLRAIGY